MVLLFKYRKEYYNFLKKSIIDNRKTLPADINEKLESIRKQLKTFDRTSILSHYFEAEEYILEQLYSSSKQFQGDSKLTALSYMLFRVYEAREWSDYERGYILNLIVENRKLTEDDIREWNSVIRSGRLSLSKVLIDSLQNGEDVITLLDEYSNIEYGVSRERERLLGGESPYIESWFQLLNEKSELIIKIENKLYPLLYQRVETLKDRELHISILNFILTLFILYSLYLTNRISKNLSENLHKIRAVINSTPNLEKIDFELKRSIAKLDSINIGRRVVLFERSKDKVAVIVEVLESMNYVVEIFSDEKKLALNSKFKEYDIAIFEHSDTAVELLKRFKEEFGLRTVLLADSEKELDQNSVKSIDSIVYNDGDMGDFRYHFKLTIRQFQELLLSRTKTLDLHIGNP
jgi:hypothetical protein